MITDSLRAVDGLLGLARWKIIAAFGLGKLRRFIGRVRFLHHGPACYSSLKQAKVGVVSGHFSRAAENEPAWLDV